MPADRQKRIRAAPAKLQNIGKFKSLSPDADNLNREVTKTESASPVGSLFPQVYTRLRTR